MPPSVLSFIIAVWLTVKQIYFVEKALRRLGFNGEKYKSSESNVYRKEFFHS